MIAPLAAALLALLGCGLLALRVSRTGHEAWRAACLAGAGLLLAAVLALVPGRWPADHWVGGADIGIASAVVGFLLVLGAPRPVLRRAGLLGGLDSVLDSRVAQLVLHPVAGCVANSVLLAVVFGTGWYDHAARGGLSWVLLVLVVVVGGLWGCAGLLDADLVHLGSGARLVFAVLVSAANQLPGVLAINGGHTMQGGIMWLITAPMVIPLLFVVVTSWMHDDARRAAEIDAQLDEWERQRRSS